jgi:hypothetical protein
MYYSMQMMEWWKGASEVKHLLDLYTQKFAAVGLKTNAEKAESMIMEGGDVSQPILKEAYYHHITREEKHWQKKVRKIACDLCGNNASWSNLIKHLQNRICLKNRKAFIQPAETEIIEAQIETCQLLNGVLESLRRSNYTSNPLNSIKVFLVMHEKE